jgi:N-acetylglutamate synthase-like GNAT family acetyltransferase
MLIRQATLTDIDKIMILANKMAKDTVFTSVDRSRIEKLLTLPTVLSLVAESKEIIGFICGSLNEQFFTKQKFASDMALYVEPEHRGSSAAYRLVKAFEKWANEQGASHIWLGQSVGQNIDETKDFYNRLGYTLSGFNTVKQLKG